ncbi:hypothetical protein FM076_27705 [Streptomyces albus subsp. chlorinus]|uniref:SseB family protein n=1 Tax=Streptomyces albus TaxID=1888 RepID=UPI00156DC919|nr:SseB family protein [Streptomyces albus]NSC24736.1 hypothetical protein [Streptomyces albus subsp. chlorinus]
MELTAEIAATRAGRGDPRSLVGEFRRTVVLVPTVGEDRVRTGLYGGVRWIYAFTDEAALARFALARGEAPDRPLAYAAVLGARLLDTVVPALGGPAGVAVDVADEEGSMLFPPAAGIVPDEAAVGAAR